MREMKDSGIDWVGEVPISWDIMKNKYVMSKKKEICQFYDNQDILSLTMKGVIKRDLDAGGKMPSSFNGYQYIEKGNLLMCLFDYDVTPRCIGLIESNGLTSPAYSQFALKGSYDEKYFYYYYLMIDNTKELLHLAKNLRHSFTEEQLGSINVPVPPIEEQHRISEFLDRRFSEIDSLTSDIEKQIRLLENYRKSFIDKTFEKFMASNEYVYAKLGNISTLITKQTGFDYSKYISPVLVDEYSEEVLPYLQTRNFSDNNFDFNTTYYIPKKTAYQFPKIVLKDKCLLFSIVGASIGNVAIYPGTIEAFLGGAICKVDLKEDINYEYVKYFMLSTSGQNQILLNINASAQGTITVKNVRDFKIPIFSNSNFQNIISDALFKKLHECEKVIELKKNEIEILNQYKKSLLYEYVTGKKEVPKDE